MVSSEQPSISPAGRTPKTADLVAANLRRQIVEGDLRPGDELPAQHLLTVQYRISRPILREALRILESEGLIEVRRGARGGARVRTPDTGAVARHVGVLLQVERTTVGDVIAARRALEMPAAAIVADDHDEGGLARLRDRLDAATDPALDPRLRASILYDFHTAVVELSRNGATALLHSMLTTIIDRSRRGEATEPEVSEIVATCPRAHPAIYRQIADGDSAGANELWARHLDEIATHTAESVSAARVDLIGRGSPPDGLAGVDR